ncbi:hypothetical protein PCASD_26607 [Puccinia coronata f. sp. avenae]|uniref:Uncharacterized protein n=1 Tax=Puccinia coronata f. sp. avenae TaxID=200324 RepID=A0A2N5RTZ7_9BASI|nr:hypothetical protein PCASD_26607 [Puccinia coronata f. sp. avenae]
MFTNIKPAAERAVKRCRGDTSFLTQQKSVGKTSCQSARERPQGSQDSGNYGQTKTNETGHEPTSSLAPRITNPPLANRISPNNFRGLKRLSERDTTILGNKTSGSAPSSDPTPHPLSFPSFFHSLFLSIFSRLQSTGPPSLSLAQNNQSCS